MGNVLQKELDKYNSLLPELLKDEGKYAVIFNEELIGTYSSYEDALQAGYATAKLESFLVKRISGIEIAYNFSRNI